MIAAAYARYSSMNQNDESIDAQLKQIYAYAIKNDINIVNEYIDRGRSGSNDEREEFQKMIRESQEKKYDAIIVHKIDRFARNLKDAGHYKSLLEENGIKLISVSEDITGASGDLVFGIMASVADWYLKNMKAEISVKSREIAQKGFFMGGNPPYGYDIERVKVENLAGKKTRGVYKINENEAKIVRIIYDLAAEGNSPAKIAKHLNDKNIKNRKGNSWNYSTLYDLVHNLKYKGTFVWSRGNHRTTHIKRDDAVVVPNAIPAIVTEEIWEKAQKAMSKRRINKRRKREYLLRDLLVCDECGSIMSPAGGVKNPQYVCNKIKRQKQNGLNPDHYRGIYANKVENFVLSYLKNELFKNIDIKRVQENINKYYSVKQDNREAELKKLFEKKEEIQERRQRLIKAIEDGTITMEDIKEQMAIKNKELNELNNIIKLKSQTQKFEFSEENVERMIETTRKILDDGSFEEKQKLLKEIINKIIIKEDNYIKIQLNASISTIQNFNEL